MAEPLSLPLLGLEDPAPAPVRLTQKAVRAAAERRGVPCAAKDWAPVRAIVCQTRLDAFLDPRFAPEGACRGIDAVEVTWAGPLRDDAPLRAVALALDAALRLDRTLVCFLATAPHSGRGVVAPCRETRLAVPREGEVILDEVWSHGNALSALPIFDDPALRAAQGIDAWHAALFDALRRRARRPRLEATLASLRRQLAKSADWQEATRLRERLKALKAELNALEGAP